jgi:hypothetical protein
MVRCEIEILANVGAFSVNCGGQCHPFSNDNIPLTLANIAPKIIGNRYLPDNTKNVEGMRNKMT